jgi:hypothetical protein
MKNKTVNSKQLMMAFFVVILVVGYSTNINAQSLEFGIRYEAQFTGLINKNDHEAAPELSNTTTFQYLNFGVGAIYNFNKNIGVAVDVLFSREGQRYAGDFDGKLPNPTTYSAVVSTQLLLNNQVITGNYVAKSELNYFKLPIMLSLTTDNTKPVFLTMLIGPQINFLYDVAQEVNNTDIDFPNSTITANDLYKHITINGVIEAGAGYNLGNHFVLSAHLRLDYSLKDVENKNAFVSYYGGESMPFYNPNRSETHSITGGMLISLDFKL